MRKNQQPQARRGPTISRTAQRRDEHHVCIHPAPTIRTGDNDDDDDDNARARAAARLRLKLSSLQPLCSLHQEPYIQYSSPYHHVTSPHSTVSGLLHQARRYPSPSPDASGDEWGGVCSGPRPKARRKAGGKKGREGSWAED
ncbi:hypothetical protein V491_08678 [Pseudogymnoascus sp. VKM F-3775]|nr:hypothetical protein V491_08678 [Pseudogymnoascus sp. VKM F-3775]